MFKINVVSEKVVGRLTLYRRWLEELVVRGVVNVFSHELATESKGTAAQVRRDLMVVGYEGSSTRGYSVKNLLEALGRFLDPPERQKAVLVGVGNLGRALLAYFVGRQSRFTIAGAFDSDTHIAGRTINGCPIFAPDRMVQVVEAEGIDVAIIAVPAAMAQGVVNSLCHAGISGILNFAPVRLWVPEGVHIEHLDLTMSLERVAYYARKKRHGTGGQYVDGREMQGANASN